MQIHAPRRYSIWQAHDRRDPGTWRAIPPRYPPAHSALGGTCVDAERGTQARYLGTSRFSETPSRETRLSSKCSIDIVLNLRVVHKLLLLLCCLSSSFPNFFPLLSFAHLTLSAFLLYYPRALLSPSFARSADPLPCPPPSLPAHQPPWLSLPSSAIPAHCLCWR